MRAAVVAVALAAPTGALTETEYYVIIPLRWQAALLGNATVVSTLATAAKTALIELSIGIGMAAAGWALNAARTGDWSTNALNDSIADAVFFTGVFTFIQTGVSAIKYTSRAYNTPVVESNTLCGYELDPRSIELAKEGNPSFRTFRKRVWKYEAEFRPGLYQGQTKRMKLGLAPKVGGKSMHLHHVVGRSDLYNVIKVTQAQHIAIHKGIGYYYNSLWTLENAIKFGGL